MLLNLLLILQMMTISPKVVERPFFHEKIRKTTDNIIVIHYDSSPNVQTTLRYLRKKKNSYHYIIDRYGVIYKLIDPKYEARHAGLSYFRGHFRINQYSIGICFVNDAVEDYTEKQYQSAAWLIQILKKRYPDISSDKIAGHSDIAIPRGRKHDPGEHFNWNYLFSLSGLDSVYER